MMKRSILALAVALPLASGCTLAGAGVGAMSRTTHKEIVDTPDGPRVVETKSGVAPIFVGAALGLALDMLVLRSALDGGFYPNGLPDT